MNLEHLERHFRQYSLHRALEVLRANGLPRPEDVTVVSDTARTFPATDITELSVERDVAGAPRRAELKVSFYGLGTVHSTLPDYFHEVLAWESQGDGTPQGRLGRNLHLLFDLIDSRYFHLLHEIWQRTTPIHADPQQLAMLIHRPVLSLCGSLNGVTSAEPTSLGTAAHVLQAPGSKWGLQRILARYLGVGVAVQEFEPVIVPLAPNDRWRLGRPSASRLGRHTRAVPYRVTRMRAVRICLGPLPLDRYSALLPGGEQHTQLESLLSAHLPVELEPVVEYGLAAAEVSALTFKLGSRTAKLGATTLLSPQTHQGMLKVIRSAMKLPGSGTIGSKRPESDGPSPTHVQAA